MNRVYTEDHIKEIAVQLIKACQTKILCFYGEMGAGKTTLIKAIVQELHGADSANSPTFGIVNEYHFKSGKLLGYHFDFYRLDDEMEALDLGLDDYLDQDAWVFIEWPEKIPSLLPEDVTNIFLEVLDMNRREIRVVEKK